MTMRGTAGFVLLALLSTTSMAPAHAAAPSFDCAKAGNWAEKEICKSDELAALDAWFAPLYGQVAQRLAGKDADALKTHRKVWLKSRNDCKAEADGTACLKARYQEFTAELERQLAQLVAGDSGVKGAAADAKSPLAECAGQAEVQVCIEKLVDAEEANLADAEAKAGDAAAKLDQADQNIHLGDRLVEANVAWRAYRNAECKRRQQGRAGEADGAAVYSSCLVDLTRARARELQM
jgi:uncharacterized protein